MDDPSTELVARWREGDQQAADEVYRRYTERLLALARRRLSPKLARRVDPEDVLLSAYGSFFAGVREERYVLQRSGDLWRLLVAITLHKLYRQVELHTAGKRDIRRERPLEGDSSLFDIQRHLADREPSPSEAAALADELEQVKRGMEPLECRVLELRLQGYRLDEIARETKRSERTVRRALEGVKGRLQARWREYLAREAGKGVPP